MILVTGASGFLGSELVRQLLDAGEQVRILRRETSKLDLLGPASDQVEHVIGDVLDIDSLDAAFRGVRAVCHTAAFVGFGGKKDEEMLMAVNVRGTANVVNAALRNDVGRMVHVSSIASLGRPESAPAMIDERTEWTDSALNTAYAVSKRESEFEVQRGVAEGLDAVIVNPSLIFGPGREGENTMDVVGRARKGLLASPAGGTNVVDVADVAAGIRAALANGETGERYIMGSENLKWKEILGTIARAYGKRGPALIAPPPLAIVAGAAAETVARLTGRIVTLSRETARVSGRTYRYSNEKARTELGCTFRPFEATARRIAEAHPLG